MHTINIATSSMELETDLMMGWRKMVEVKKKTNSLWAGENVSFLGEIEGSNWSDEKCFSCYAHVLHLNVRVTCVASVSARVCRESLDESKKKEWPLSPFFCSLSNYFRAITRLETLATQANVRESKIVGFQIPRHGSRIPGQNSSLWWRYWIPNSNR